MIPKATPHAKIDKSQLAIGVPSRIRSSRHLAWIRTQRCCVPGCGHRGEHAHHLTIGFDKARGLKGGDDFAVPLCARHHQGQDSPHHEGDEAAWWAKHGVDPIATAEMYWRRSPARREA